jgi:hypothetical protein
MRRTHPKVHQSKTLCGPGRGCCIQAEMSFSTHPRRSTKAIPYGNLAVDDAYRQKGASAHTHGSAKAIPYGDRLLMLRQGTSPHTQGDPPAQDPRVTRPLMMYQAASYFSTHPRAVVESSSRQPAPTDPRMLMWHSGRGLLQATLQC